MSMRSFLAVAAAVAFSSPAVPRAETYTIDKSHTAVTFGVRHLFTEVQGRFDEFDGTIDFDPDNPAEAKVKGTIKSASVDTDVEQRDEDLRSENFFHAAEFPEIQFESTKVTDVGPEKKTGKMHGNLTMHGVTKPVVLDVEYLGSGTDPWGNQKAGFRATTRIDRRDWGLTWNKALEAGNVLVGNDVEIRINAEADLAQAGEEEKAE